MEGISPSRDAYTEASAMAAGNDPGAGETSGRERTGDAQRHKQEFQTAADVADAGLNPEELAIAKEGADVPVEQQVEASVSTARTEEVPGGIEGQMAAGTKVPEVVNRKENVAKAINVQKQREAGKEGTIVQGQADAAAMERVRKSIEEKKKRGII